MPTPNSQVTRTMKTIRHQPVKKTPRFILWKMKGIHSFCANIFNVSQRYPFNYVTKSHYCHSIKPDSRSALYCYITLTFGISLRTRGLAAFMLHKGCSPIRTFEAKLEEIVPFLNNCNNAHICRVTSIRKMDS